MVRYANRRYLFVFSSSIIFLSTSTIATFFYMNTSDCCFDSEFKDKIGMVPLLAVISMFVGHALGVVPVCQLTAAEVFPTEIRTLGSGICVAVATIANAVNSKVGHKQSTNERGHFLCLRCLYGIFGFHAFHKYTAKGRQEMLWVP